jgi:hypothetical protein
MPESEEHRKIKELLTIKLKEWIGCSIPEYYSAGHELDIFCVTPRGVSIYIEIIWSPSNFMKDINMIQQSDANVKLVIASPDVISSSSSSREFVKVVAAQRIQGKIFHGEMIDGKRVLENDAYIENTLKPILLKLVEEARPLEKRFQRPKLKFPMPQDSDILPDGMPEELFSNIFPVVKTPEFVYSAPINSRIRSYPWDKLKEEIAVKCPYIIRERKLFTFENLQKPDSAFKRFIEEPVSLVKVEEWMQTDKAGWLIQLLNCVACECCKSKIELQQHPKSESTFFFRAQNGGDVVKNGKTVVQNIRKFDGTIDYLSHDAVSLNFLRLEQSPYLVIKPRYVFTKDGKTLLEERRAGPLALKWAQKEYNPQFFERIKFWVSILKTGNLIDIPADGEPIEISTIPINVSLQVGIAWDQKNLEF